MDTTQDNLDLSPEEQKADEEALQEAKDEEIREKIATDMDLDPEVDAELIEKIVKREQDNRKRLSGAIKQKIGWREKLKALSGKEGGSQGGNKPLNEEIINNSVRKILEERDLESLGLPEELVTEVKDLAKLKGISVREAANHSYIKTRREEIDREARIAAATPKRSNKGSYAASVDPSKPLNPADFNLSSEEGVKAWKEAKVARDKYLSQR